MAGQTQDALYREISLDLSWSERDLPQVERTKHVHALHPYLGKFIPQLAEHFLRRSFAPGALVFDPFVGSGTTLVEANALGIHGLGSDISAFNCLLSSVKTARFTSIASLELGLRGALEAARRAERGSSANDWLARWFSPRALAELLAFREAMRRLDHPEWAVASVVLSRAARSARLTPHFDLDFPREPVAGPYYCHKHKRTCRPVDEALKFLTRYTKDTVTRLRAFQRIRTSASVTVRHADSRAIGLPPGTAGVLTSPPYPGLIDYHEQHRYAFELLGLPDERPGEIGPAAAGTSRRALDAYVADMTAVFANAARQILPGGPIVIVVNDSRRLYPAILDGAGLDVEERITRHVNRRTGRRAGEFYEDILVCRAHGRPR